MHDLALHPAPGAGGGRPLLGLSLCSGAGGLDLGLHIAEPGYRAVGYGAVLVARMEDQVLAPAPVWDDLASFDGRVWRGAVDLVLAGYPCQPFSVAGRRRGADDPRHDLKLIQSAMRLIERHGAAATEQASRRRPRLTSRNELLLERFPIIPARSPRC